MGNKKDLKKTINYICSDLFAECVAASLYGSAHETRPDDVDAVLSSIILLHKDYVSRISHPEPGMPQKKYFKDLIAKFNKKTDEIIDQIQNLN